MQKSLKNQLLANSKSSAGLSNNPENLQEKLTQGAYVHHDHGGHEHGHNWDDIPKTERKFKSEHEGKKKVLELGRRAKETSRAISSRRER